MNRTDEKRPPYPPVPAKLDVLSLLQEQSGIEIHTAEDFHDAVCKVGFTLNLSKDPVGRS